MLCKPVCGTLRIAKQTCTATVLPCLSFPTISWPDCLLFLASCPPSQQAGKAPSQDCHKHTCPQKALGEPCFGVTKCTPWPSRALHARRPRQPSRSPRHRTHKPALRSLPALGCRTRQGPLPWARCCGLSGSGRGRLWRLRPLQGQTRTPKPTAGGGAEPGCGR